NWTAASNDSWITITSGASGTGSGAVNFSVAANGATSSRSGTMTIAGQTFTVTQTGVTPTCSYSISPTANNLYGSNSGSGSVSVSATAGCSWTAASNISWLTVTTGASGTGNGTVNYSVAANPDSLQRTGTLTIAGQTYTVTQVGRGCATLITPLTASFTTSGGSLQIRLDTALGCSWTITNIPGWVTVTSGTTGTGTKKINYTVAANSGAARHADLVISGQVHSIDQAGSGGPCTYAISPTSQTFIAAGGSGSTNVTTQAGCNWTAASNDSWITITSGASGTGNGTASFNVAANASTSQRSGTMTIAGQTFTVTQLGASPTCSYAVSPTSQSFTSTGGTGSSNVTTTAGCNWTAASNDSWITITSGASQISSALSVTATSGCSWTAISNVTWITVTSGASGTGSGTVGYTVLANPNRTARSGTMTIAGQTFTINQAAHP
ncbi:MAG: BACON domain-containing protein, partial [Acidobacteria bacterium]|nr:BACON domain-containing protein [Acidobacteriota bacterium]